MTFKKFLFIISMFIYIISIVFSWMHWLTWSCYFFLNNLYCWHNIAELRITWLYKVDPEITQPFSYTKQEWQIILALWGNEVFLFLKVFSLGRFLTYPCHLHRSILLNHIYGFKFLLIQRRYKEVVSSRFRTKVTM